LDITRLAFSGGQPLSPYIQTYSVDLFLSKDHSDEQHIINSELCAAAIIYAPPSVKLEDESKM
jgi:5'-nucleotidase